jgi:CHASE3 domain sensor protein
MTRLSVRAALVVVCFAAAGAAGFLIWTLEQQSRAHAFAAQQFSTAAYSARTAVSDLRGAQQAYVAAGQGPDFWFARVSAISKDLRDELGALKSLASAPDASVALDDAAAALQDFDQMDRRARDFARGRQLTAASDLIFADGFDLTKKAGDALDRALTAELADRNGVLSFLKKREAYTLAGGSAVFAIVLALLLPGRREKRVEAAVQAPPTLSARASKGTLADLHDLDLIARPAAAAPPTKSVNLGDVAELCTDLAKVSDPRALPAILERAAGLLDAAGLVVWIADPDGRELAPILVHGYPPHLATRLGTIPRDATNVTASAYRTGLLQTMKGDAVSNGAIAAPLVSAAGCVGVLAAEMKDGGERHEQLLSAAKIVASQLATLVGPPSVRAARSEAAG